MLRAATQPQLPTECLALILEHVWDDLPSLHSLLCCSQTFFHLTVPVLYRDPFCLIDRQQTWSDDKKTRKTAYLMRILCICARTRPGQDQKLVVPQGDTQAEASFLAMSTEAASTSAPVLEAATTHASPGLYANARSILSAAIKTAAANANATQRSNNTTPFAPALPAALSLPLTIDYLYYYTHQGMIRRAFLAFEQLEAISNGDLSVNSTFRSSRRPSIIYQDRSVYVSALSRASLSFKLMMVGHSPSRIRVLAVTPSQLGYMVRKANTNGSVPMESLSGGLEEGSLQSNCGVEVFRMLRRLELDFGATNTPRSRWGNNAEGQDADDGDNEDYPLQFIREHQRLFVDTTSTISPPTSAFSGVLCNNTTTRHDLLGKDDGSPKFTSNYVPLLQELVIRGSHPTWSPGQVLTKIEPLQVIDLSAWNSNVPDLVQIPRTRLRSLKINIARRLAFVEIQIPYLRQCSQLEEVWLPAQSPYTFRWAIDMSKDIGEFATTSRLKRRYMNLPVDNDNGSSTDAAEGTQADIGTLEQQQLQQQQGSGSQQPELNTSMTPNSGNQQLALKRLQLYGKPCDLVESLEDAADAFRDSLEEMTGYEDGYGRRDEYPRMCISWPVPRLTKLHLRGRFVYFFDLSSLKHCPDLQECCLQIESNFSAGTSDGSKARYQPKDFEVFAGMKRLRELQLRGASWGINNDILEVLKFGYGDGNSRGRDSRSGAETDTSSGAISYLPENLRFFSMAESHLPTPPGLVDFVQTMRNLQVIQLGTKYGYAKESIRDAGGSRLFVEINPI